MASDHNVSLDKPAAPAAPSEAQSPKEDKPATDLIKSTFDVQVTLADQQMDPNSPLFSVRSFEELGLSPDLLKGIFDMNFSKPSKIQERALPLLLRDPPQNLIGQSQSGTGKTAAFALTMLSRVDFNLAKPQALCVAPTRELARQIMAVVNAMGKYTPVRTDYAIKTEMRVTEPLTAHIVVGTPGTMADYLKRRIIDPRTVKVLVLDEADNMLDQENLSEQCLKIKNFLSKEHPTQIILFSATFPDRVRNFANKFAANANKIELKKEELSVEGIKQFYMDCKDEESKYEILVQIYNLLTVGQSIIFTKHRNTADRIAKRMTAEGHKVASLHGAKDAAERDEIIDRFRDGHEKVLITTNVMARGIDILQVNVVVNYDLPMMSDKSESSSYDPRFETPDVETYLHRIGRTGRFGRKGVSINFVHNKKSWEEMHMIEEALGRTIIRVDTSDVDVMEEIPHFSRQQFVLHILVSELCAKGSQMAFQAQSQGDLVTGDQYRYVLTNFRIAHEKVEQQRVQLQEQEKQVAELRARIRALEGRDDHIQSARIANSNQGGTSVDDWSIKNTASKLEKLINHWAADVIREPPIPLSGLRDIVLDDILGAREADLRQPTAMLVQSLLRHAMAETISEAVVNCLIVTNSHEANVQLTRIHEHLFARDPTVASVWRRQTFSAAVEACSPSLSAQLLAETVPALTDLFTSRETNELNSSVASLLEAAVNFSRMLHSAGAGSVGSDTFYRAFVPELGSVLYPRQVELIKRCLKSESGLTDHVGATVFPGLVKVSKGTANGEGKSDMIQTVVRRAQVICACALEPRAGTSQTPSEVSADSS
ncbi:DBP5 [Sanghuangporus vaninii]